MQLVIEQLDGLLASPVEQSPFYGPAERDKSAPFQAAWKKLLAEQIAPAIERYRSYLRDEYLGKAREAIAITANPDGEACYQASFRAYTTIERPAAETFELGRKRVEKNLAEALEIGRKSLGAADVKSLVARINDDRANHFGSREELLAFARRALAGRASSCRNGSAACRARISSSSRTRLFSSAKRTTATGRRPRTAAARRST